MENLLGGKGANLAEMTKIGLLVPPGFIITTEACREYLKNNELPKNLLDEVRENLKNLEAKLDRYFGSFEKPLLLSIRSGAPISMPGMMDTVLNLGLNDSTVQGLAKIANNERFAYDCYRRFIQMYSNVVLGIKQEFFEDYLKKYKSEKGLKSDTELSAEDLKNIVKNYKSMLAEKNILFPEAPMQQLDAAIKAVFRSWNNPRAVRYRELNKISSDMGTAVNVQCMVFGNIDEYSGTGVIFTRNPSTGEKKLYGEFLMTAQGEDVVAGIRTPKPIEELEKILPATYRQLEYVGMQLEKHYKDMQDIEFTIESNQLYILQTRSGKRTPNANIKIAVDMAKEYLITKEDAILKVMPEDLEKILHKRIDPKEKLKIVAKGLNASPGAATGIVIFDTDKAAELGKKGEKVILVREETTPDDIHGMAVAEGVLTSKGGMTAHAAVVCRGMGKPCVCGCEAIEINYEKNFFKVGDIVVKEGETITINGTTGDVILGAVKLIEPEITNEVQELLTWANEIKTLSVRANADTPEMVEMAKRFGAEGIGLCRTERMFSGTERLPLVRKMILADTQEERNDAINALLPYQKEDFKKIFRIMGGLPITIRLLDPPIHEFLPSSEELLKELAYLQDFKETLKALEELPHTIKLLDPKLHEYIPPIESVVSALSTIKDKRVDDELISLKSKTLAKVKSLEEVNPMLGHRGVRVGITYPEIYEMQARAIFEAASELELEEGLKTNLEIMVPQVCTAEELKWVLEKLHLVKDKVEKEKGVKIDAKYGTMIEVVRACMSADKIADYADFFSFGTNDLTQATFSFSREDAEKKFLPIYMEKKILHSNPFQILDEEGVGKLMKIAVQFGRERKKDLKIGICGEHGGEPNSITFCHNIGIDYVSCSPFRIPVARLAAARAKLLAGKK